MAFWISLNVHTKPFGNTDVWHTTIVDADDQPILQNINVNIKKNFFILLFMVHVHATRVFHMHVSHIKHIRAVQDK